MSTRRKTLSDTGVQALKPRAARYAYPDPELRGHYVRVTPNGTKSFVALARDPDGKQVWATLGGTDLLNIEEARELAREAIKRIKDGLPAIEERKKAETFDDVADDFIKRHVEKKGLRSRKEIERLLDTHVRPRWGAKAFASIRRADVVALLDDVEDGHSARQADYVLAIVRKIMNRYAVAHEDYQPPVVPGMARTDPKARQRNRILNHDELRAVWKHAETKGRFGAIVRLALLTAQRREKLGAMRWEDITADGVWTVPAEPRAKGAGGALQLPKLARAIIAAQARVGDSPYVFPGRGNSCFGGWSKCKKAFDEKVPIPPWTIHDLRRTARSLMSDAGVRPDIAERVLGHAIPGVAAVYDRSKYHDAKAGALKRLAGSIAAIVDPEHGRNVVRLKAGR